MTQKFKCRYYLTILLFLLSFSSVYAQNEQFASDRPGLSDSPDLIDVKSWQIATGFDLSKYNHYQLWQISANTLKYGISKRLEARLDFGLQYDREQHIYGVNGPSFGLKALLINHKKWFLPKTALIIEFYPPPFGNIQQASGLALELCFAHSLKNGDVFYYNLGNNWRDLSQDSMMNGLIGYSKSVGKIINIFAELYGYKKTANKLNYVSDVGTTIQLNKKLQIDLSFGMDLVKPSGNTYTEGGITYNF